MLKQDTKWETSSSTCHNEKMICPPRTDPVLELDSDIYHEAAPRGGSIVGGTGLACPAQSARVGPTEDQGERKGEIGCGRDGT